MLLPAWSTVWSLMMPSTVITAIFFRESLSSSVHSSSRGPTSRAVVGRKPPRRPELNPELNARETNWVRFPNRLMASRTSRMIAKIIQPRLLRGLAGGGGVMTGGGGGINGGGSGGVSISIACQASPGRAGEQGGLKNKSQCAKPNHPGICFEWCDRCFRQRVSDDSGDFFQNELGQSAWSGVG